jgi:hypothetical protein
MKGKYFLFASNDGYSKAGQSENYLHAGPGERTAGNAAAIRPRRHKCFPAEMSHAQHE